jgi:hypothetical protein
MASFNNRQGGVPEFQKNFKIKFKILPYYQIFANTALSLEMHRFNPRFCWNWYVFYSMCWLKTHNSASSVNTLCTAESAQFYFAFLPTMISLTPRCRWKRENGLNFFTEDAQNDLKRMVTNEVNSATAHNYARCFQQKRRVIKNFYTRANLNKIFENVGCTLFWIY